MSQIDSWLSRWQQGQIGFHLHEVHPYLETCWRWLDLPHGAATLVPMCGKSLDVTWLLKRGHRVVALDVSPAAIENLMQEGGILARRRTPGNRTVFESEGLHAVCGDFFRLDNMDLGTFQGIYDRAAFGAMAPSLRPSYVSCTRFACEPGSRILLIVLEYPDHETAAPPFSIPRAEVMRHYGDSFSVEELVRMDILEKDSRMQARGVTQLHEVCYGLRCLL